MDNIPPNLPPNSPSQTLSAAQPQLGKDDGHMWGMVGFIAAIAGFSTIGMAISIVGYYKSKKSGYKNILALWGIILGAIFTVIGIVLLIIFIPLFVKVGGGLIEKCNELGPGTHKVGNMTYECGTTQTEYKLGL